MRAGHVALFSRLFCRRSPRGNVRIFGRPHSSYRDCQGNVLHVFCAVSSHLGGRIGAASSLTGRWLSIIVGRMYRLADARALGWRSRRRGGRESGP